MRISEEEFGDPDAIEAFLIDAYGAAMRIDADADRWVLRHRRADAGAFAVDTMSQSSGLSYEVGPLQRIVVTRTGTSRLERVCGRAERRYDAGELFLMSDPDLPYRGRWLAGEVHHCVLDPLVIGQVAASARAGTPAPIRFTALDPVSPAAAATWWATRCYVADLLSDQEAAAQPLLLGIASRMLAAATLTAFPNTAVTDPTIEERHDAHPATLRRAVAFIEENAHRDITVADIAAAAHVTMRTIQLAFRRHLNTTPMRHLRLVRLARAHRRLGEAGPTTTVAEVAAAWGFPRHDRFTALYRRVYGISPEETLRRGR